MNLKVGQVYRFDMGNGPSEDRITKINNGDVSFTVISSKDPDFPKNYSNTVTKKSYKHDILLHKAVLVKNFNDYVKRISDKV
jgi:hypothetical protein